MLNTQVITPKKRKRRNTPSILMVTLVDCEYEDGTPVTGSWEVIGHETRDGELYIKVINGPMTLEVPVTSAKTIQ